MILKIIFAFQVRLGLLNVHLLFTPPIPVKKVLYRKKNRKSIHVVLEAKGKRCQYLVHLLLFVCNVYFKTIPC